MQNFSMGGAGFEGNRAEEIKPGNYVIMYVANINPMNRDKSTFHFPVVNATAEDLQAIKEGKIKLPVMSGLSKRVLLKIEEIEDVGEKKR